MTSVKSSLAVANADLNQVAQETAIDISDCIAHFYSELGKNDPPYVSICKKFNNDWLFRFKQYLIKMSDNNGKIKAMNLSRLFNIYYEGTQVNNMKNFLLTNVPRDRTQIDSYLEILNLPIEEMVKYGPAVVSFCLNRINEERYLYLTRIKYDYIYRHPEEEWLSLFNKHKLLIEKADWLDGKHMVLTLEKYRDVVEKATHVMSIKPQYHS